LKLLLIGSTGSVGTYIANRALNSGIDIVSLGRSHFRNSLKTYPLESEDLSEIDFDLAVYLITDYTHIRNSKRFIKSNLEILIEYVSQVPQIEKVIYLASDSARQGVKSSYGRMKFAQELLARDLGMKVIKIGWLEISENGNQVMKRILDITRRLFKYYSPKTKIDKINLTSGEELWNEIRNRMEGKVIRDHIYSKTCTVGAFLAGGALEPKTVVSPVPILIKFLWIMRPLLPRQYARAIDSAATLLL
jgi:hypothetical protein